MNFHCNETILYSKYCSYFFFVICRIEWIFNGIVNISYIYHALKHMHIAYVWFDWKENKCQTLKMNRNIIRENGSTNIFEKITFDPFKMYGSLSELICKWNRPNFLRISNCFAKLSISRNKNNMKSSHQGGADKRILCT